MIELKEFSKSYSKKDDFAVKEVSLKVEKGSITGLIGPNGSGKTTIMKAICGFHYPSAGSILISDFDGNLVNLADAPEKAMQLIGYVPEIPNLPPEMQVKDFLKYAGQAHGIADSEIDSKISEVTKLCTLEKILSKKIKTLSKGQKQRVSFAQALIFSPPNLVLDEPVSGLDPAQIIQMRNLIQKLSGKKAILMSTHILQEIYSLCENLYILNEGQIAASGSEEEIIRTTKSKSLEDAFIKLTSSSDE